MAKGHRWLIYLLVSHEFSGQMTCFETKIRHGITISRIFPGHVLNVIFKDHSLTMLVDSMQPLSVCM